VRWAQQARWPLAARSRKRGRRQRPGPGDRPSASAQGAPGGESSATSRGVGGGPPRGRAGDRAHGTTTRPAATAGAGRSRSEERNAAVRATLTPLAPGERPWAVTVGSLVAALLGAANLTAYLAGVKIGGKHPAASGIIVFAVLMGACAIGLWRMWYGAVLGFMALLAIIIAVFTLLLIKASNLLGFLVPPLIIAGAGYLFWKLVRALSRIQMPAPPTDERR